MFSDLVFKNSRRSRKENGLFLASLVISIMSFYIILSLSRQDVMIFLAKMESDAVNRLLRLIPVFYGLTLGILFFLIYFACKYQLERRRKEFGVYLMMGMRRSRLFIMLLAEDFLASILALVIGIFAALLLSEIISLVTAKLVGLGIIGHQFTFSLPAVIFTIVGFLVIKLAAFLILSSKISRQEIGTLLVFSAEKEKKQKSFWVYGVCTILGVLMLAFAYTLAIKGMSWYTPQMMLLTLSVGLFGTLLLFYGMRAVIAILVNFEKSNKPLHVFTFRQIQENVICQSASMAISSLLILGALCCFGAGIGISESYQKTEEHIFDYTFYGYSTDNHQKFLAKLQDVLKENGLENQFSHFYEVRIGHINTVESYSKVFQMDSVMEALGSLAQSEERDILLNNLSYEEVPYLISLSDYNHLLESAGKPILNLKENEAAVYQDPEYTSQARISILNQVLSGCPEITLGGNSINLTAEVQSVDLVTDRSITLSFALILPDEQFLYYTGGKYDVYINGIMNQEFIRGTGLLKAISGLNDQLDKIGLEDMGIIYESYLQNIGRQLFYIVASSYITIYLAIIFLVVANTVLGVQFLMNQQKTGRRYQTLVWLGATYKDICISARKQINWFMGLPGVVAAASSLFGVKSLLTGLLSSKMQKTQGKILVISVAVIVVLCVVEYAYMIVIKRSSDRYLLTLMESQREE